MKLIKHSPAESCRSLELGEERAEWSIMGSTRRGSESMGFGGLLGKGEARLWAAAFVSVSVALLLSDEIQGREGCPISFH